MLAFCTLFLSGCSKESATTASGTSSTSQDLPTFPYLRVIDGALVASYQGVFAGEEHPVKVLGAIISNQAFGGLATKYDNGTSTAYHDLFWSRVALKADPHAFLDLVVQDLQNAGLNGVRVVINYCETGGGATDNVPVGCQTTTSLNTTVINLIKYFINKCAVEGILVDVTLFDQFRNYGSDNVLNKQWLAAIVEEFKNYNNIIWGIQNEPMAYIWYDVAPANVTTMVTTLVSWYDEMATYLRQIDVDLSGNLRHPIGINTISTGELELLNLDLYDMVLVHHGSRAQAVGGNLDSAIYQLSDKGKKKAIILEEMVCADFTNTCSTDDGVEEYFDVVVRALNNRIQKNYGGITVNGGFVWTLYNSQENGVTNDWGIYDCLPDIGCADRTKSHIIAKLGNLSLKTDFSNLTAITHSTVARTLVTSVDLWDATAYNSTTFTDPVWSWEGAAFIGLSMPAADSIKGTYNRAYCWGERLTGPLQLSGANDNLDDATDLFMSFTLLDGNCPILA